MNIRILKLPHNEYKFWQERIASDDIYLLENMHRWAEELKAIIDKELLQSLEGFAKGSEVCMLVKNCPIGNLPDTPVGSGYIDNDHVMLPAKTLFALFGLMKIMPISYIGENQGRAIRHVVPKISRSNQIGSHGNLEFNFHVDNPDSSIIGEESGRTPCLEFLALYCLRGDAEAVTEVVTLKDVIKFMTHEEINIALSPIFDIKRPESFEDGSPVVKNVPLLTKFDNKYFSRFDFHNIQATNKEGKNLLNTINEILINNVEPLKISLEPGDFLIFKNQETMHKRSLFHPKYNGIDRWLMRLFGMNEVPTSYLYNQLVLKS